MNPNNKTKQVDQKREDSKCTLLELYIYNLASSILETIDWWDKIESNNMKTRLESKESEPNKL